MGLSRRIFSWFLGSENRWENGDKLEREGAWWSMFAPKKTSAGASVTERNAMQLTTVYACVRIISETIASLPLIVYKKNEKGGKDRKPDHPAYKVLHDEANPEMTAFSFWETIFHWVLTHGNGYAEIERDGAGRLVALWPLSPEFTYPDRKDGKLVYRVHMDGKPELILPAEKVLHIHGLGWDGRTGYSPIQMARESIGFAKATEEYGSRFFGEGGKPGGVLEMDGTLRDRGAADRVRESWAQIHGGPSNSHRIAILEAGMKYKPISLPPNDAQFLETRRFQKADIAQIYRVPLHMLNDLTNATFSNIEHQSIEFVVHTIRPYLVRAEQEIRRKLFNTELNKGYTAEWLVDGLLRGDAKSRNEALQIQRQNGIINADEWRAIENMNPQDGEQGKAYLVNSAMIAVDQALIPMDQRKPKVEGGDTNGKGAEGDDGKSGSEKGGG